ncbi:MAG: hypothetical protein R3181_11205 [Rubricoccaceae bacterium]|nr:hypothetical protein [Rubricoccaceae bacterium]
MPRLAPLLFTALLLLAACGESALDDPDAIAERIAAAAAENFEGVRDFTVRGDGMVVHFRRAGADSLAFFEGRAFTDDSARQEVVLPYALPNGVQLGRGLRGNARLAGTVERDGETLYVLDADDPGPVLGAPDGAPTTIDSIRVYVDAEAFRVREVVVTTPQTSLDPEADASAAPLVNRRRFGDFRTVDGVALPFLITTQISGVVVPEETRAVQGGMLELQRRQAQQLPAAERARVLEQIENRRRFLTTGELEETFAVEAAEVNAGIPEGTFGTPPGAGPPLEAPPAGPAGE